MTKPRKRRSLSVEHRSTKRRKVLPSNQPVYSTRVIDWEEQLRLPPRFHEEKDVWPVSRILKERGVGIKKEYLLEWEAHPETGEIFEPTWIPKENVGREVKKEWRKSSTQKSSLGPQNSSPTLSSPAAVQPNAHQPLIATRRTNNRCVIPDSSAETEDLVVENSAPSQTPTLAGSPDSIDSVSSQIEISETQQPRLPASVRVNLPPAPTDKADWESLRESQLSGCETPNFSPSLQFHQQPPRGSQSLPKIDTAVLSSSSTFRSPQTLSSESPRRSRSYTQRDRGQSVQQILSYQPSDQLAVPGSANQLFSTAPQQPSSSIQLTHDFGPQLTSTLVPATSPRVVSSPLSHKEHSQEKGSQNRESSRKFAAPTLLQSSDPANSQPWVFQSQLPLESGSRTLDNAASQSRRPKLSGRCARKTTFQLASQESAPCSPNNQTSAFSNLLAPQTGMAARGTRQSPRLQSAVPHTGATSPRMAVRTNSYRARAGLNPPEHSSPLAATAEFAESGLGMDQDSITDSAFINGIASEQNSSNMSMIPTSIAPSAMHIDPIESSISGSLSQESAGYDAGLHTLPTPVQESIEEEQGSSAEEASFASKASSSQESLRNERLVPQVDGLVMPTYPILGPDEYVIALPAEGKTQALYSQTIKVKRKAILKFIRRRGSVNNANTSSHKTIERNEMIELVGRLHDTTTHIDLGLPGIPTQYTIPSKEHAAYAEYAGSKFVLLGRLMDLLQRRHETIVIMAKSGATQDLLEEYLYMKNVKVRRYEKSYGSQPPEEKPNANPHVELLSTKPHTVVQIQSEPSLIIAFDASFESLDPQVRSLRASRTKPLPIVHLLVTNSSEHVERCLPPSMPSPIRLRLLVRAIYQAHMNLGGSPTIITNTSDEMDGRPMDLGDISRAVRKSPNRRLGMVAAVLANAMLSDDFAENWTLSTMSELALDELDESPSTGSTVSATPARHRARSQTPVSRPAEQPRNRSRTPMSRAGTPSARKRQLEVDTSGLVSKRQRMTPVTEFLDVHETETSFAREHELQNIIESLRTEMAIERKAKEDAQESTRIAEKKASEWQLAHAKLQRRYEQRIQKSHQLQKVANSMTSVVENSKSRVEKVTADNGALRQQVSQLKKELEAARGEIKAAGGDMAVLELAREESRTAQAKVLAMEKSLDNTKRDFEFVRTQYQEASSRAAELGSQVGDLEGRVDQLSSKASDEKRRLKELNHSNSTWQHMEKIQQLEAEKRSIQLMYKRLEEENKALKRNRGVQTRGSSMAPGSPGQRSRQGSPAPGNLVPPSGSRASVLRHER